MLRLVEGAGGEVWTPDGQVTNGTSAQSFTGTVTTAADELYKDQIREKSAAGQALAMKQGRIPMRLITGLRRAPDGSVELAPKHRVVTEAFKLRLGGATILQVRAHLAAHGIKLSYNGVKSLLRSPQAVGDVVYRGHRFPAPSLIDRETFRQVQKIKTPRGRKPSLDRLLARLDVLRCGNGGARMTVGMQKVSAKAAARGRGKLGAEYPFYRCGAVSSGDCQKGVTISAPTVEQIVSDAVRKALADIEGRASAEHKVRDAAAALDQAQAKLDALIGLLDPLEPAAACRLAEATERRDEAQDHLDARGGVSAAVSINAADDWDRLNLEERRDLIRATVERASVSAGRGADRVTVELFSEKPPGCPVKNSLSVTLNVGGQAHAASPIWSGIPSDALGGRGTVTTGSPWGWGRVRRSTRPERPSAASVVNILDSCPPSLNLPAAITGTQPVVRIDRRVVVPEEDQERGVL